MHKLIDYTEYIQKSGSVYASVALRGAGPGLPILVMILRF